MWSFFLAVSSSLEDCALYYGGISDDLRCPFSGWDRCLCVCISLIKLFPLVYWCFRGASLSGIVTVQTIIFFKLYPDENKRVKSLVSVVWYVHRAFSFPVAILYNGGDLSSLKFPRILDVLHTALIGSALWRNLITNFARPDMVDSIPQWVLYFIRRMV